LEDILVKEKSSYVRAWLQVSESSLGSIVGSQDHVSLTACCFVILASAYYKRMSSNGNEAIDVTANVTIKQEMKQ